MIDYDKMDVAIGQEIFFSIDNSTAKITICYEDEDLIKTQNNYNMFYFPREICSFSLGDELFNFLAIPHEQLVELSKLIEAETGYDWHHEKNEKQQYMASFNSIYIYLLYYSLHRNSLSLQYASRLDRLAKEFEFALNFCCNNDFYPDLKELTSLQRYYLYSNLYVDNIHTIARYYNRNDYVFLDYDYNAIDGFEQIRIMNKQMDRTGRIKNEFEPITEICPVSFKTISSLKNATISLKYRYSHQRLEEYLMEELFALIRLNCRVKKCAYCGKYFILKGDYSTDCCDRIPEGQKYSCKKLMAQKRRKEKLNSDPITKEYEKAYKRMYARVSNGAMKKSEFVKWSDLVREKRDNVIEEYTRTSDQSILQAFKEYLGNK